MGRFKKGESGNPHGRPPKSMTWAKILADVGEEKDKEKKKKKKQLVAEALYTKAMTGDVQAARLIADLEGEILSKGEVSFTFKWEGANGEDSNGPI